MSDDEVIIDHSHDAERNDHTLRIDHATTKPAGQHKAGPADKSVAAAVPASSHSQKATKANNAMQTVVQINVYREVGDHFEYLLLKRIDQDSHFWQVATEPVDSGSTITEALRGATNQLGLHGFKLWSQEMHSYEWYTAGERGKDIVFSAELEPTTMVSPDPGRYSEYQWLTAEEAVQKLKWNGNKDALRALDHHLVTDRRAHPLPPTTGLYPTHYGPKQATVSANSASKAATTGQQPAGSAPNARIPKRLPDVPENKHPTDLDGLPIVTEDSSSTSALFL